MLHRKLVCSLAVKSALLWGMLALPSLAPAWAQKGFPDRTVTLVVPSQPGGSIDFLARLLSEPLSKSMGVPVVVENKPGASGNIGNMQVARARPDGYTLLLAYNGFLVGNPHLYKTGTVDPVKELAPVSMVAQAPQIIVATNGLPANDIQALIQYAQQHPGKLNYASSGYGSVPHLAGELLRQQTGAKLVHIPYKGGGQAMADVVGGTLPLLYTAVAGAYPYVQRKQIKAIAVSTEARLASLPDVPTVSESGVPGFVSNSWIGILAPAGTPEDIVAKLQREINAVVHAPDIEERLAGLGITASGNTPQEFRSQIASDLARYAEVVKAANIRAD